MLAIFFIAFTFIDYGEAKGQPCLPDPCNEYHNVAWNYETEIIYPSRVLHYHIPLGPGECSILVDFRWREADPLCPNSDIYEFEILQIIASGDCFYMPLQQYGSFDDVAQIYTDIWSRLVYNHGFFPKMLDIAPNQCKTLDNHKRVTCKKPIQYNPSGPVYYENCDSEACCNLKLSSCKDSHGNITLGIQIVGTPIETCTPDDDEDCTFFCVSTDDYQPPVIEINQDGVILKYEFNLNYSETRANLTSNVALSGNFTLEILDLDGRLVEVKNLDLTNEFLVYEQDFSNFISGTYIVNIRKGNMPIFNKLINITK